MLPLVIASIMSIGGCDAPAAPPASNAADPGSAPVVATEPGPAASVVPSPTQSPAARRTTASVLPADVTAFKSRREQCDHFRGEEAGDDARAAELERKLEQTCKGTDAALASLRKRYANDKAVIASLAGYEGEVE